MDRLQIRTLGALRAAGVRTEPVRDEVRRNLLSALRARRPVFDQTILNLLEVPEKKEPVPAEQILFILKKNWNAHFIYFNIFALLFSILAYVAYRYFENKDKEQNK